MLFDLIHEISGDLSKKPIQNYGTLNPHTIFV